MKTFVHVNFACSIDGKIALKGGMPYKFSNLEDLQRVHRIRSESDAIVIGKNTIQIDDPKLVVNSKYYQSDNIPDVIVLDSGLGLNRKARIFQYNRKVIIITGKSANPNIFNEKTISDIIIKKCEGIRPDMKCIMRNIEDLGYERILVEGGKSVLTSFIESDQWDIITIFYSPVFIGNDGISMIDKLDNILKVNFYEVSRLGNGFLLTIKR